MNTNHTRTLLALAVSIAAPAAAQQQVVKPPQAQAWIDVATFSGMGMPAMGMPGMGGPGGGNPMAALGSLFGGGGGAGASKVNFLMTQSGGAGRYVDVTLLSRTNPQLAEAAQDVPPGLLSPALKLVAPRDAPAAPAETDDEVLSERQQRPEGRLLLYWGCGDTVRPGQPRVIDFATASPSEIGQVFQSRRATQRGAHAAAGRPHWPNPTDGRALAEGASLVGAHQFSGSGVPQGFRFNIPAAQDLMPPLQLQQADQGGALALSWNALPNARGFFVAGMGSRGRNELVLWTSSEVPDAGMGLVDYQTNAAVDRWLRERVLLAPATTHCTVPKGVFAGEGAMLRAIAYGHELNLVHPPRPTDPKVAWEPLWAVKVRVKSMASAVVGMPSMDAGTQATQGAQREPADSNPPPQERRPGAIDILRGVLGR